MKGGHAHSGRPPDPNALRRERDSGEWVTLPAAGREGPPPAWPLTKPRARESALWEQIWQRPQAVIWERNDQVHEVAMYVRTLVEAEKPGSPVNRSTMWRQLADSLGLTTPGLRANRWRIEQQPQATANPVTTTGGPSARERLRVVAPDDSGP